MRYLIVLSTLAIALATAATASAGGFATVGLDPLSTGVGPGETWNTKMTVLQHGVTPLEGLSPTITITLDDTGATHEFVATATDEPGVYDASVVFPEAGQWRIVADSTFGDSKLTYGPVLIEPGTVGASDPSSFPTVPLAAILGGLALLAALLFGLRRMRRLTPASS